MPAGGPISCDRRSGRWRTARAEGPPGEAGAPPRRPPSKSRIAASRPQLSCTRRSTRRSSGAPCSTRSQARTAAPAITRSRRETGSRVAMIAAAAATSTSAIERHDREPAVSDAAEADDGRGRSCRARSATASDACRRSATAARRSWRRPSRRPRSSASAPTVAGARRSAGASAKQRNGSSGIRKRGPGRPAAERERDGMPRRVPDELDERRARRSTRPPSGARGARAGRTRRDLPRRPV